MSILKDITLILNDNSLDDKSKVERIKQLLDIRNESIREPLPEGEICVKEPLSTEKKGWKKLILNIKQEEFEDIAKGARKVLSKNGLSITNGS